MCLPHRPILVKIVVSSLYRAKLSLKEASEYVAPCLTMLGTFGGDYQSLLIAVLPPLLESKQY